MRQNESVTELKQLWCQWRSNDATNK